MPEPFLKLTIQGDKHNLNIYETEPGIINIEIENEDTYGSVETDAQNFIELLQKLISKEANAYFTPSLILP